MDAEAPVDGGAVDAEEDPVRHRRPCRVPRVAIKAHLVLRPRSELPKHRVLVGEAIGRHGWSLRSTGEEFISFFRGFL